MPRHAVNGVAMTALLLRPSCDQRQAPKTTRKDESPGHLTEKVQREPQIRYEIVKSGVELGWGSRSKSTRCADAKHKAFT